SGADAPAARQRKTPAGALRARGERRSERRRTGGGSRSWHVGPVAASGEAPCRRSRRVAEGCADGLLPDRRSRCGEDPEDAERHLLRVNGFPPRAGKEYGK